MRKYVYVTIAVIAGLLIWNFTVPTLRTTGRFLAGGWAAAVNAPAPAQTVVIAQVTPTPQVVVVPNGNANPTPAPEAANPTPAPEAGPAKADGPVEEEYLGQSIWNGPAFDWDLVPDLAEGQFLVAHGDLKADGGSYIAAFTDVAKARKFLKHGTWKMVVITISEGESLDEYLEALNERLGAGYSLVLKP